MRLTPTFHRFVSPVLAMLVVLLVTFSSSAQSGGPLKPADSASRPADTRVILISVDGLRPDAIQAFQAKTLLRLMHEGSFTLTASTILPSKTLPSHTSMLTGELPEKHGVLWNDDGIFRKSVLKTPTIFGVLHSKGLKTAAFFSKSKFDDLQLPGTLDFTQAPGSKLGGLIPGRWDADRTTRDAQKYLRTQRPNFLFVHFGDVDYAGHRSGWMSQKYGQALQKVDGAIAQLLSAADAAYGDYTVIVTADHGGHGKDHGSDNPLDVRIPWIAWGKGIHPGPIASDIRTTDTASTVLWLFGVQEPTNWAGSPVTTAFTNAVSTNN